MDCSGPVFSMPLDIIMLDQGKGFIPFIAQKSIEFLEMHCKYRMGCFYRCSGRSVYRSVKGSLNEIVVLSSAVIFFLKVCVCACVCVCMRVCVWGGKGEEKGAAREEGEEGSPRILCRSDILYFDVVQSDGLFIQSGNSQTVQELIDAFDRGEAVKITQYTEEPNVVADLLLTFLRRLPDPPFAYELYDDLIKATKVVDKKKQVQNLRFVCDRLEDINHNLLESVLKYLNRYCNSSKCMYQRMY